MNRLEALMKKLFLYCALVVMGTMVLSTNAAARDNRDHERHVRQMHERHEAHEKLMAHEHQRDAWKRHEERRRAERRE